MMAMPSCNLGDLLVANGTETVLFLPEVAQPPPPLESGFHLHIEAFFKANAWMGERYYGKDRRHKIYGPSWDARAFEFVLAGSLGDVLENLLRRLQLGRIKNNLKSEKLGFEPRVVYSDEELEFHPDTKRIHNLLID